MGLGRPLVRCLFSVMAVVAGASNVAGQPTPALVKDINPGFSSSIPSPHTPPVVAGGIYYFVSNDNVHGLELWRSDGTPDGTFLVKDINAGSADGASGTSLFEFGGSLFFTGRAAEGGWELWSSDGSEVGTTLAVDVNPGTGPSTPQAFHAAGGKMFFEAGDAIGSFGMGLYVSDGTAAGTLRLMDAEKTGAEDWDCASVGATLYCSLQTDPLSATRALYATDGTVEGTRLVAPSTLARLPQGLTAVGSDLFFWASDDEHGLELWKSDGTEAATVLVKDCAPGPENSIGSTGFLGLYAAFDGGLLFSASAGNGSFMWSSDGTEAGTVPVGDSLGANEVLGFSWLTSRGPDVFFQGSDAAGGRELWITDGTQAGTRRVKDINPGRDSGLDAQVLEFTLVGNQLFFVADDGVHDWQLWRSDGTEAGTVRLTDFLTNYDREIRPRHVRALGSKVLFFADDDAPGAKLFSLDVDAPAVTDGGEGTGGTGTVGGTAGTSGASGTAMGGAGGSGTTAAAAGGNGSTGASANTSGSGTGGSDAGAGGGAMGSGDSSSAGENGSSDAATDPGESRADRGGCNCRASGDRSATGALSGWLALIALAVAAGRRTLRRAQERT